jgi:TRAP-type C4-dicarboxylate transport system permease small subunit
MTPPNFRGDHLQSLEKWLSLGERLLVLAGALATFAMMCLTSADAVSRYLFNSPIVGAYEITEKYLMVAAVFLGLSFAYRGGGFIRVTFLVDRLSGWPRRVADYFAHAVSFGFCVIFTIATAQQAIRALSDDTTLSALPILVGPAYWFVPLGFGALTLLVLRDLSRVESGKSFLLARDEPTT